MNNPKGMNGKSDRDFNRKNRKVESDNTRFKGHLNSNQAKKMLNQVLDGAMMKGNLNMS